MEQREYIKGENAAKRRLRKEVGFGCPICRNPFLTYHHFDPPWRVLHHWNPDGVIALCRNHHDTAEGGHYTNDYLRELKSRSYSVLDIKQRFPWTRTEFIVRVGGLYSCGSRAVISVDDEPVIQINAADSGLLSVSLALRAKDGSVVARMVDDVFEAGPTKPFDLHARTTKTQIRIWHQPRNIGLDVSLNKVTPERLDEVLSSDRVRQSQKLAPVHSETKECLENTLRHLPEDLADRIREDYASMMTPRSPEEISRRVTKFRERFGASGLPDHFLQAHYSGDPVGHRVKSWSTSSCTDSDGRISLLNFDNLLLYGRNRQIRIRNGIGNIEYNAVFDSDTAFAL